MFEKRSGVIIAVAAAGLLQLLELGREAGVVTASAECVNTLWTDLGTIAALGLAYWRRVQTGDISPLGARK